MPPLEKSEEAKKLEAKILSAETTINVLEDAVELAKDKLAELTRKLSLIYLAEGKDDFGYPLTQEQIQNQLTQLSGFSELSDDEKIRLDLLKKMLSKDVQG